MKALKRLPITRIRVAWLALWQAIVLAALAPSWAMSDSTAAQQPQSLETQPLMIRTQAGQQHFVTVEVADDRDEQSIGLMFRTQMAPGNGMIFLYQEPRPLGMWMKNTLISLDMLFLDARGRIINIHKGAVPGSLQSIRSAAPGVAVVELAAGQAKALGLAAGDEVFHCHFENFPCERSPAQ